VLSKEAPHVLGSHAILDESYALRDPGLQSFVVLVKVDDGNALWIDIDVLDQDGNSATRYCSKTYENDPIRKFQHLP
jgi:hypothetical protein